VLTAGTLPRAAVPGLTRSDPHGPGITRERAGQGFRYRDPAGAEVTSPATLQRISALVLPPGWTDVWISPDPLGHIQATGVDSRGRTQYRYHQLWREQRDAQKFAHMLRFAAALPALRAATVRDLGGRRLGRDRVAAGVVRLIDLGLFRIGGEKYAELDHHYGATTLLRRDVTIVRDGIVFDYTAKEGKRRTVTVTDYAVRPVVRALLRSGSNLDSLFCWQDGGGWRPLRSHEVSGYIAAHAGGHFTAKEFRTWNATVLMALLLANAEPAATARSRKSAVTAAVRGVADWLGDTPAVARAAYIDPRLISRYESAGELPAIPRLPAVLPAPADAEIAVAALLGSGDGPEQGGNPAARATLHSRVHNPGDAAARGGSVWCVLAGYGLCQGAAGLHLTELPWGEPTSPRGGIGRRGRARD
jgi:DNA topoisomerase I